MIYDVIITKDTVVIIWCHCIVQQLCLWWRYILMYGFSKALLKSDNNSVTGPPKMIVHSTFCGGTFISICEFVEWIHALYMFMCASQWWEKYWDSLLEKKNSSRFKHPVDTYVATLARQPCLNFWPPAECRYDKHSTFNFVLVFTNFSKKYLALKLQNAPLCSPACC